MCTSVLRVLRASDAVWDNAHTSGPRSCAAERASRGAGVHAGAVFIALTTSCQSELRESTAAHAMSCPTHQQASALSTASLRAVGLPKSAQVALPVLPIAASLSGDELPSLPPTACFATFAFLMRSRTMRHSADGGRRHGVQMPPRSSLCAMILSSPPVNSLPQVMQRYVFVPLSLMSMT